MGQTKFNTTEKSETREFVVHPSGFRTSGFPIFGPSRQQIESAARRALDDPMPLPRRRISPFKFALGTILIAIAVYLATYFVLAKVLG